MLGKNEGHNLVIGDRTLFGIPAHDERFAMSREVPSISSTVKGLNFRDWDVEMKDGKKGSKTLFLGAKNYCNNSYKPEIESKKTGNVKLSKNKGRLVTVRDDYHCA